MGIRNKETKGKSGRIALLFLCEFRGCPWSWVPWVPLALVVVKEGQLNKYLNNIHSRFLTASNETFVYVAKTGMSIRNSGSTSKGSNGLHNFFLT